MSPMLDSHLLRPRLTAILRGARMGAIEAAGGYGKSSLAAELRDQLDLPAVEILLPAGAGVTALIGRIAMALRRAGASDLATRVEDRRAEPAEAVDALLAGLSALADPWLVVLDDVHEVDPPAAVLAQRLVSGMPEPHRVLVAGRMLPSPLTRLRRDRGVALVDGDDLLFTVPEIQHFLEDRLASPATLDDAQALRAATGGWAAAVVLSASLVARAGDPAQLLGRLAARPPDMTRLVQESLRGLPVDAREAVIQLAHLPDPGPDLAEAVGAADLLEQVVAAGFPLTELRDGAWSMPGPVVEILVRQRPASAEVARRAAPVYLARNDIVSALQVLSRAGAPDDAAGLLAAVAPGALDGVDLRDMETIVATLPETAVARYPRVLLHLARSREPAAETRLRAEALARASALLERRDDPAVRRELDAELARDLARDGRIDEARALASGVLGAATDDEPLVRARALLVLGMVASWQPEPASLADAERHLEASLRLCRAHGQRAWASQVTTLLAIGVQYALGRFESALRTIDDGLADLPAVSLQRAVVLTFRAEVLSGSGRAAEAEVDLDEADRLAGLLRDDRAAAYAAWERAKTASLRGDAAAVMAAVRAVERHLGDWYEHPTGAEFLADAADALDRAGEVAMGATYLERAMSHGAEHPETFAFARAGICARACVRATPIERGALREQALAAAAGLDAIDPIPPREAWRSALIRAALAVATGGAFPFAQAARAFDEAAALGIPELPLLCEPAIGEALLPVAVSAGSAAAREASRRAVAVSIRVLGGFEVRRGRTLVEVQPGKPEELVKILAAEGGRIATDEALEELWPETDDETSRRRLRNVLSRIRDGAGELVVRDGGSLAFPADVEVDATRFETEARRAQAAPARERAALARAAAARYRGELLPDDRYAGWAAAARERLHRRHRALLDLLVVDAQANADLDEALRLLERTIESDPYDEQPYLAACRLLIAQGRRAAAASMLARAGSVIEQLAIPVPAAFRELERRISS